MNFKNLNNFIMNIPANYLSEMAKKNVAFVGNCKDLYTFFKKINKNCKYFSMTKQNWKNVVKLLTQKDKNNMPKFDVIVGNPPYTRGGKDTRPLYIEILNEIMINSYDSKIVWICPTQWVYGYNIKGHIIKNFKENYKINDYVHIANPFADAVMANLIGIYCFDNNNKNSIDYEDIFYTQFKKPELVKSIEQKFKKFNGHLCDYNNNENSYKYYVNAAIIRGHIDQDTGKKKWDWTTLFGEDQRTIFDRKLKDRNVFWKFKTLKECKIFVAMHETDILEFAQFIEKSNSNICLDLTPYLGDYTHEWTETEIAKKLKLTKEEVEYIHQEMANFGWKAAPKKKV